MLKLFKLIPLILWLVGAGTLLDSEERVQIYMPSTVEGGKYFDVEVEIVKGDENGFARLIHKLPDGLYATAMETNNAEFYFENGLVKFIWLRMPKSKTFKVRYRVFVNDYVIGKFNIKGDFSHVNKDNTRNTIENGKSDINITPNPNVNSDLLVDINDFVPEKKSNAFKTKRGFLCLRETPYREVGTENYIVNIAIARGDVTGYSKVQETIPVGFDAEVIEAKGATFSFKNNKVKFLWHDFPQENNFIISYRLIPKSRGMAPPFIVGDYSYIENNKTVRSEMIEKDIDVRSIKTNDLNAVLAEVSNSSKTFITDNKTSPGRVYAQTGKKTKKSTTNKRKGSKSGKVSAASIKRSILVGEKGIYYRVQIAAIKRPVDVNRYFRKYKFKRKVQLEKIDGWYKYSVGSFPVYRDAKKFRDMVWCEKNIRDAFIAAYSNGRRITIQEALMATHHQWIK